MANVSFWGQNGSVIPARAHQSVKDFSCADNTSVVGYLEHAFCDFRGDIVSMLRDNLKQLFFYCID